ncbi:MAG: hypothetical protein CMI63_00415 [Parvularcula sp.]|nr:hypothetical protein [Parvularcula sp.]
MSKLIFTVSILLSAYVAGMKHPITADSSTIDNLSLLAIILLFLGISIDRIISKIKKLVTQSD